MLLDYIFYIIPLSLVVVLFILQVINYNKTSYYAQTQHKWFRVYRDKGLYGEYLIYKKLNIYESDGAKFLFNLYVPKSNGKTSEIDVVMIHKKGIFVFESKNYSGWIFGSEENTYWTQTLRSGNHTIKERFYNPILQNRTHIKSLLSYLNQDVPTYSIITFSERCRLKKINTYTSDVYICKRNSLKKAISYFTTSALTYNLSEKEIDHLYQKLYPLTQVSSEIKLAHIKNTRRL